MKSPVLFEGQHEVMILFPNDVTFPFEGDFIIRAKDVAAILEYRGKTATSNVLKFCKDEHIYHVSDSNLLNQKVRKLHSTGEKFISNFSLNRVLGQSNQPKARPFQNWLYEDMLPSVQQTGSYTIPGLIEPDLLHFKKEAYMVEIAANVLRLPDSGRLKLLGDFNKAHRLNVPLPGYADEPITESATELLKKNGIGMQAKEFNKLLIKHGYLEEKERPSKKGGTKLFKSLTESGLEFGKNIISPNNPRETAPHYYPDKFPELLEIIGL
ncbi:BRO family protein [Paenibacillus senegalensis]|uniref:BRO family protein n=1 Tax=Paenibacillus senegalensis TaxID=1465766 RepID=UPI0002898D25|nr:Bro-N domain-containing protein [Paenibacillus senegalensis]